MTILLKLLGFGRWLGGLLRLQITAPLWVPALTIALWGWIGLDLAHQRDRAVRKLADVQAEIDRPVTGWAARLKDCQEGRRTLQASIDQQNAAMTQRSGEATQALKDATARQAGLKPLVAAKTAEAARILRPLTEPDVCQRMFEVDARFLEQLK